MSKASQKKAVAKAAKAVAAAYKASVTTGGGDYTKSATVQAIQKRTEAAINAQALDALGGVVMGRPKKPRRKLSKAERAARGRVLAAHRARAARAARLPGKKRSKKTSRKKTTSKRTVTRAAAPATRRAKRPTVRSVTADGVVRAATQAALKKWLCEGPKRSGCGRGGSRVITGQGRFVRIRPPRFMAGK